MEALCRADNLLKFIHITRLFQLIILFWCN